MIARLPATPLTGTARAHRQLLGTSFAMVFQDPMSSLNPVLRTGEQLVVHRLNDEGVDPTVGERVVLHWAADHSYVIGGRASVAAGAGGNGDESSLVAQTEGA